MDWSNGLSRLGGVVVDPPAPVVAGSVGQWTVTFTVGSAGIDEGGTIKIAQRFASDWEPSQFDRPTESGFTTATTTGAAKLRPRYDRKGHDRPWMHCIVIDVYDGSLSPGDVVKVVLGDQSQGSPGIRAQTFIESKHEFRVFVDPTNACVARAVPGCPTFPVVCGEAVELVCIVPTQGIIGKHITPFIKGQDRWGNPTIVKDIELAWNGTGTVEFPDDGSARFSEAGAGHFSVRVKDLACQSNPITVHPFIVHSSLRQLKKYWGDLHAQSDATVGTGTEEEYFRFARDVARLDFCSHQGNDFQVTDEDWKRLNDVVRAVHRDHEFVVFPGWEWSGNTPAGGDRNVIYLDENQPIYRSSHWQVPEIPENDLTPAPTAADLFARVRNHRPDRTLLGSHVGGRYADIRKYFDAEIGPLVELVSCWGVFEWMLWDAFDMEYIVGIMCNSDGHKGRPGAEGPGAGQFGIANGLTCVLAEEKTRAAIFTALKSRRCYGTTGARIDLAFQINEWEMGSVINNAPATAAVIADVRGTGPIESIELFEGKHRIAIERPAEFETLGVSEVVRVSWRGSRMRGRGRRVNWDGAIRLGGAKIQSAVGHFDTPVDGIRQQSMNEINFVSQTTGDTDFIDLVLDSAERGKVMFDSQAGRCEVDLSALTDSSPRKEFDFGGLDMRVIIERYPRQPVESICSLRTMIRPPATKTTPYFVKVTQCDGQMAWASPIYLQRN